MDNREKSFAAFANRDFSELTKIVFKPGYQPRNATDYYYHAETDVICSYYWCDGGKWTDNVQLDINEIESPKIYNPNLIEFEPIEKKRKCNNGCRCIII